MSSDSGMANAEVSLTVSMPESRQQARRSAEIWMSGVVEVIARHRVSG